MEPLLSLPRMGSRGVNLGALPCSGLQIDVISGLGFHQRGLGIFPSRFPGGIPRAVHI